MEVAERRAAQSPSWMLAILDEIDCGVLLVREDGTLLHANRRGRQQLGPQHSLQLIQGRLRAVQGGDVAPLQAALHACQRDGRRRLLSLGDPAQPCHVAVLPLERTNTEAGILLVLGRQSLSDPCTLQWYAHDHGLTPSEQRVLEALIQGQAPEHIADRLQVGISTVRTHIGALREKTGSPSIRALLHRMAALPPLAPRFPS